MLSVTCYQEAIPVSSIKIETPHESITETESALNLSSEIEPVVLSSINEGSLIPVIEAESDIISPTEPVCMKATEIESDISSVKQVHT